MADESQVNTGEEEKDPKEVNPHREVVLRDVKARSSWADIDSEILKRRMGKRPKKKQKPYPGAPNGIVPIVDDVTREKTDQEISMTTNAPVFAHIIPLAQVDQTMRAKAELAFDAYLRHIIKIRSKLEEAMDTKNARGFGVFKVFRSEHDRLGTIPDTDAIDPRELVVPQWTKGLNSAERITHVLQLTKQQLDDRKEKKSWRNTDTVWETAKRKDRESVPTDEKDAHSTVASLVGLTTSGKDNEFLVVWEYWHYATQWDVDQDPAGLVELGKKCCTIFSPDDAGNVLMIFPWTEDDTTEEMSDDDKLDEMIKAEEEGREPDLEAKTIPGKNRPWPFVQARYENRSRRYYDSRGVGRLCMDDQIFATAQMNAKMTMLDYYQQPLLEGTDSKGSTNITFEPGSMLPRGAKFAQMPTIPSQFDFDIESHKRVASRRAGAGGQYEVSGEYDRTRKVQKTATEVRNNSARTGLVSSASVDRFNDPLAEVYQQLWDDLARMRKPLPLIEGRAYARNFADDLLRIYSLPVMVISASSAKTLDPDMQFMKARTAFEFVMEYKEIVPIEVDQALRDILSYWDPFRASQWLSDPNKPSASGQPPVYVVMQGLQEQISALGQGTKAMNEEQKQIQAALEKVVQFLQKQVPQSAAPAGV